ncbi:MAG: hypothetical protein LDLANPLL_02045 [Turneriella sp.]|nr:hypothetical protein [Turneriella sp.]
MKVYYTPETDSMMISFKDAPASEGNSEIRDGVFLMHGDGGEIVGIEFMGNASKHVDVDSFQYIQPREKVAAS